MKIANFDTERIRIFWEIEEYQWNFQERRDNSKSHKKPGFYPVFRRYIFGKTKSTPPPATTAATTSLFRINREQIVERFYEKELQIMNQTMLRVEKVMKRKGDKLYFK